MEVGLKMVNMGGGGGSAKAAFEETELRLGLPGKMMMSMNEGKKRSFVESESESESGVDLKLNLASKESSSSVVDKISLQDKNIIASSDDDDVAAAKPPAKAQVVGWPPVRSYRKNMLSTTAQKSSNNTEETSPEKLGSGAAALVKVSMDGAPYLRKVDLKMYKSYQELSDAMANMFSSFTIGKCGAQGMKDFMNESKLIDVLNGSDYVPTYEDKDGDWMLIGDVPWEMFVGSCKRLRIMKGTEAIGLAPRAVEKCKKRS
ncbi:hypothetical protein ACFE04_014232 [Oxalis oulophora]